MKKSLFLLFCVIFLAISAAATADVVISSAVFEDAIFKAYVSENFDKDSNGVLSDEEISHITEIDVRDKGISSMKGIEYFPRLEYVWCSGNNLTTLDITQNPRISYLDCQLNQLTSLDLSQQQALILLECSSNKLTELDVAKHQYLHHLGCVNNELTELDITNNRNLETLSTFMNHIKILDVTNIYKFAYLVKNNRSTGHNDGFGCDYDFWGQSIKIDCFTKVISGDYVSEPTAAEPIPETSPSPEPAPAFPTGTYVWSDGNSYTVGSNGQASFAHPGSSAATQVIPAQIEIDGYTIKVTAIADKAFRKDQKLTSVMIGKNVKTIGRNAFASCTKLTTIKGGTAVVTIREGAFDGCKALNTVPGMKKLQTIGATAFRGCVKLTKFTLESAVKSIGKNAFNGDKALKTITVKTAKLTTDNVRSGAFKGISSKATFKCPKKKVSAYKKVFIKAGAPKTCKFK